MLEARDVPISDTLATILAAQAVRVPSEPEDPVFPAPLNDYGKANREWRKTALRAGLHGGGKAPKPNATIHDLRHTFAVSAMRAGVPLARLQKLLGHATPHMTMRYMKHAPEAFFAEDAACIDDVLTGTFDRERDERAAAAKHGLKRA